MSETIIPTKALQITRREALGFYLNEMGLTGEMAEIGCAFGGFTRMVLPQWKGKLYYMIDPWKAQDVKIYKEAQGTPDKYEQWHQDCQRVAAEDARVRVIRDYSVEASKKFKDGQLDHVFIDGNHAYPNVLEDMDSWWPKIRLGGLMGGHDFYNDTTKPHWCEVEAAVRRWTEQHAKTFYICPCSSWFVIKDSP
jgi:hypothetical protein